MKHLGDICKLRGAEFPSVDCVIGGSPCQDLSIAGKRQGFSGERSVLFLEQIRIIKEMRENDRKTRHPANFDVRPRFMVWENVCGAFSSNQGKDFRSVLEETARIADENAVIPGPPQGKWRNAGVIMGDGWSIAWRVHDAQFWGVPQRRRRISLVADFAGQCAPEICFVRKSLPGNSEPCEAERKEASGQAVPCTAKTGRTVYGDTARTLTARYDSSFDGSRGQNVVYSGAQLTSLLNKQNPKPGDPSPTLSTDSRNYALYKEFIMHESGREIAEGVSVSLRSSDCKHPPVKWWDGKDTVQTLTASLTDQRMPDKGSLNAFVDCRNGKESGINGTLQAKESGGSSVNYNNTIRESDTVRRLTPLECERLQGFPDGWTDIGDWTDENGKVHKTTDSNRYKALGNSIALPFWKYLIKRISAMYERDETMASLFDGIAGFPFLWEQINGKGSCLWASEIDSFARAVSERRINGGSETDQTIGRAF